MARSSRSAFTLLETLLALAIAFVVVTLVYSVFHSVQSTVELQQSLVAGPERAVSAMGRISDDLSRAFVGPSEPETRFRLVSQPGQANRPKLTFCALRADETEQDVRWADAVLIGIETIEATEGHALIQVERPLVGPGSLAEPATNRLVNGVADWTIEVFDGEDWLQEWPPADRPDHLPRAVRLTLEGNDGERWETEVLLHAQAVTESSFQRGSTGQP